LEKGSLSRDGYDTRFDLSHLICKGTLTGNIADRNITGGGWGEIFN